MMANSSNQNVNYVELPLVFVEAKKGDSGVNLLSDKQTSLSSKPGGAKVSSDKYWFPMISLFFSILFLAFNLIVFNSGKVEVQTGGNKSVLGETNQAKDTKGNKEINKSSLTNQDYIQRVDSKISRVKKELKELDAYQNSLRKERIEMVETDKSGTLEVSSTYSDLQKSLVAMRTDQKSLLTKLEAIKSKLSKGEGLSVEEKLLAMR